MGGVEIGSPKKIAIALCASVVVTYIQPDGVTVKSPLYISVDVRPKTFADIPEGKSFITTCATIACERQGIQVLAMEQHAIVEQHVVLHYQ